MWTVNGAGAGSLDIPGSFVFSAMESLVGGTSADQFLFGDGASLTGALTDKGQGALDYSARSAAFSVNLATGAATAIAGGVSGIGSFIGTGQVDTFIGPAVDSQWLIDGSNQGTVAGRQFSSFENLTGGVAEDVFVLGAGGSVSGIIDGAGGLDTLQASGSAADDSVTIAVGVLNIAGRQTLYANIDVLEVDTAGGADTVGITTDGLPEYIVLRTGLGNDRIRFQVSTGSTTSIDINAGGGTDSVTVQGTADADDIDLDGLLLWINKPC